MLITDIKAPAPRFEKVRHELRLRTLTVRDATNITPEMLRLELEGEDLADFTSLAFDDHVKVVLPNGAGRRDYTPRRFDRGGRTLAIDFALHEVGAATDWARATRPGDQIEIAAPKGSSVPPAELRRWLLIGDETALPAVARFVEEAGPEVEVTSLVAVTGPGEEQVLQSHARHEARWAHRPAAEAADAAVLVSAVDELDLPVNLFVWIAAEASVAKALRSYMALERGQPLSRMKAAGYWARGRADAHERIG